MSDWPGSACTGSVLDLGTRYCDNLLVFARNCCPCISPDAVLKCLESQTFRYIGGIESGCFGTKRS